MKSYFAIALIVAISLVCAFARTGKFAVPVALFLFIILGELIFVGRAHAEPFTQADIIRQSAITGLLIVDQNQTQQIREAIEAGSNQYGESNPVLRKHFSETGIRNYFIGMAVGSAAIARILPPTWRPAAQYGVIAYELFVVVHNKRAGLHFTF